ncbi:hypothetical protein COV23_01705 [Candidatus Wolfebacteria bacterium CG10_big_fil_rev_8_21_14_0_10_31_9]|uniref:Uncharacterized protein n=1 Tax=Candidatus Wolfebacteria bacterium CG10_big_fil_rev_8_21_14_0_10_31_9 TaxID=1975070 RepID=A0A2H0RC40_9BACT|nr:MAG: hypothetical protein COV23_01705 [Candidatus Wolfebacteria bacterium CG10_big_fil_rev_8_21_14_0_10_31_9]
MDYKKLFGYGVLIWAVVYLVATAFVGYKLSGMLWTQIVLVIISAVFSYFLAKNLSANLVVGMLKYSFSWMIMTIILSIIFTVPFTGWIVFNSWDMWASFLVILLVPLVAVKKSV